MAIEPLREDEILANELREILETRSEDIRRIAGSNGIEDMFTQFAELMPHGLRQVARQLVPNMVTLFRDDYLRLEGTRVVRGSAKVPFPEDQSWIPAGIPRWEEAGLYRIQLPNTGKSLLCQRAVSSFQVVVFSLFLIIAVIVRAVIHTPSGTFIVTFALFLAAILAGVAEVLRMYCDPTPVMLEWRRGEDPKLFQNNTGGWAS